MVLKKKDIEMKILDFKKKIYLCHIQLKNGHDNPSELRNAVVDYKLEIKNLEKLLEVC